MALDTLKGVTEINGRNIIHMDDLRKQMPEKFGPSGQMDWEWFEKEIRPNHFIYVRHDKNSISFTLQNGPIKHAGINGCQVDDMVAVSRHIIEQLNEGIHSIYNDMAVKSLNEAMFWLHMRKKDREKRKVEGTYES